MCPLVEATFDIALRAPLKVLSVTGSVEALLGYSPLDFLSCSISLPDRIHAHDANIASELFSPETQKGSGSFNIRLRHADGRIRCVRGSYKKRAKRGGEVTLRLKLQDARSLWKNPGVQRTPALFRAMLQNTDDFIFFKDRNHVFNAVSQSMTAALDPAVQGPTLLGQTDYEIFPEEFADIYYKLEKAVFAGASVASELHESQTVDRRTVWLDNHKYPIKNNSGKIVGLFGVVRDITERTKAQQSLRESQKLLELLMLHAPVSLSMFDRDMRYLAVSRRGRVDFDLGDREILGLSHYETVPWLPERFKEMHRRALSGETVRSENDRFEKSDGTVIWGRSEVLPWRSSDGSIGGVILFTEDITEQRKAEIALRESKELLQLFIQNAPAALAMLDSEMRYLAVSRRWLQDYGLGDREIIGHSYYEILPEIPYHWREVHRRALQGEIVEAGEDSLTRSDGSVQWMLQEVRPWRTGDGAIGGIIIFTEDITRQKQAAERLNLAAHVFAQASEGIVITDSDGSILDVNDAFTRISGYTHEEVLGRNPSILSSGLQSKQFYADMWRDLIQKGHWSGDIWNRAKDGKVYAETLSISALRDASGNTEKYLALFSDITSLKEHEKQLEHIANYDILTGLPNRTLLGYVLTDYLTHAIRRERAVTIAHFNLDNFKTITAHYGRDIGDQLLIAIAGRVKLCLRGVDTLARIGGDDFVAILLGLPDTGGSLHILAQIMKAASEPVQVGDLGLEVSASAGVTFFPQTEEVDADQLLRQASQALFQAKLEGKNRYSVFDASIDQSARHHHEDIKSIRGALDAKQLVLYYQPKVNMCTGAVIGVEALIRWLHPERGLLPPSEFLPAIEGHSLAIDVGNWVINSALVQMELWHAMGLEIPVSVNIGAEHLQQADFVDNLSASLKAHPSILPPSLELEVLESSAIRDLVLVSEVIRGCKHLGVSFALDDFGTGYSSLAYLKRLPADVLKIDQVFVGGMLEDPGDLAIVEGILGLATAFQCRTVAEGVETLEHGLMLLRLGCPVAQGYAIARAMPARDLPAWVSAWKPDSQWKDVLPYDTSNRPVLYANVEHNVWIEAIVDFLSGNRQLAPAFDLNQCRFGAWLRGEALVYGAVLKGRGGFLGFRSIDLLHRRIHALADEIISLNGAGRKAEAMGHLAELHVLAGDFFERLNNLVQA